MSVLAIALSVTTSRLRAFMPLAMGPSWATLPAPNSIVPTPQVKANWRRKRSIKFMRYLLR